MRNIKAILSYDGTGYLGWQKTRMGPSIEEQLQTALETITRQPIVLQAASRTDAGVHAEGQVINFFLENDEIDLSKLLISLNQLLPHDIAIVELEEASSDFHPTLDAKGKEYHYTVSYGQVQFPRHRFYSWHTPYCLDLKSMKEAARFFIGEQDFSSFCNVKKNDRETNFVRTIHGVDIVELPEKQLRIIIRGNRFLYKMARNIAGTLVAVGRGKILPPSAISGIFAQKDRTLAGPSAPAHGLSLFRVFY